MSLIIVIPSKKDIKIKRKMKELIKRLLLLKSGNKSIILDLVLVRQSKIPNQPEIYLIWLIYREINLKNRHKNHQKVERRK